MEAVIMLVLYTVVMFALTVKDKVKDETEFNVSNRNLGWFGGGLSIAATWIWAPALFVSAEKAYSWGWKGLAWFLIPNILCLMLFAPFGKKIRKLFPNGVTLSGFMQDRLSSKSVGNTYRFQLGSLAILSTGVQLLAGSKILSVITGIPFWMMTIILSAIAYSYSRKSGILASVKTDALQMVLILLICAISVPWAIGLKGFGSVAEGFQGVNSISGWEIFFGFGLPTAIGLVSGPFGDQCFWQRAFSINQKKIGIAFVFGALAFGIVPLSMGILGFVAGGSGFVANDSDFVNFELIKSILPTWFMIPFLFMVVSGLLSTVDSNLCAISSIVSDVKSGLKTARVSMIILLVLGIAIANIPSITVTDLFLFYGTLRSSTLCTTLLTLFGKRLNPKGVSIGIVSGILVGLPIFAYGSISEIVGWKIAGSLITLAVPAIISLIITKGEQNENNQAEAF